MLSEGQAHDSTAYEALMDERDSDPGAMLADKGYDSDPIRQDLRDRGAAPEIPTNENPFKAGSAFPFRTTLSIRSTYL